MNNERQRKIKENYRQDLLNKKKKEKKGKK
jgi:hypothetical protein